MCGQFDVVHMSLVHPKIGIADTFGNDMLQDHISKICIITIAVMIIDACFMTYANTVMIDRIIHFKLSLGSEIILK